MDISGLRNVQRFVKQIIENGKVNKNIDQSGERGTIETEEYDGGRGSGNFKHAGRP